MNNLKMQTPPLPKGTRDFYPESMRIQNYIFDTWRKAALRFGYEEYEGPMAKKSLASSTILKTKATAISRSAPK